MAGQYDGEIRINTAIETDGFVSGGKEVEAAARRMAKTVSGIGVTAKIALQKQTDAFVKQNQLYAQQEQKVNSLKEKLKELSETQIETTEFAEIGKQIDSDTAKLNRLEKAQEEFLTAGWKETSTAYKKREAQIRELQKSIQYAKAEQDDLLKSGQAYTTPDTSKTEQKLSAEKQKLAQMQTVLGTSYEALKAKVQSYGGETNKLEGIKNRLIKSAKKMATGLKRVGAAMLGLNKSTKNTRMSMGKMLATSLLFSTVFKAISTVTNGIKEGMQNLAQYSGTTNASLSSLMSALTQLKNSFATAFAPILNVVAPILTTFINMISHAVTYVGMLIAALTGQKTFTKAIGVQQDYASSLGNTANSAKDAADATKDAEKANDDYLSGLDEVRKFETNDTSDGLGNTGVGSGISGGLTPDDMFETVNIGDKFSNIADKIKESWENSDFTEIGTIVGEKLKNALDSVPWDKIKKSAEKIAKTTATFLNGFFETPGLFDSIGNTLAESVNTGLTFAKNFLDTFHWDSLGSAITTGISSFLGNIDWKLVGGTISSGIIALLDYIRGLIEGIDWSEVPSAIAQGIKDVFTGFDWKGVFESLGELVGAALKGAIDLGKALTDLIGDALSDFYNKYIDPYIPDVEASGWEIVSGIFKGIADAIADVANWIYDNIFSPFIEGFKEAFKINSPSKVMEEMGKFLIEGLFNGIKSLINKVISIFKDIKEKILKIWNDIKNATNTAWNTIKSYLSTIWNGIKTLAGNLFTGVKTTISNIWNTVKNVTSNVWNSIKSSVSTIWNGLKSTASTAFGTVKNTVASVWNTIKSNTTSAWNSIKSNLVSVWNGLSSTVGSAFTNVKSIIANTWENVRSITANIWRSMVSVIKNPINGIIGAINGMISGVVSGINSVIRSLNRLRFRIPNWVPILGGRSMGFNINYVSAPRIPYLATGAVIPPNAPFMAMLGDQKHGNNIEAPEDLIRKIVREEAGGRQQGNAQYKFTAQINRRTLFEEMMTEAQLVRSQTGMNPFEMA